MSSGSGDPAFFVFLPELSGHWRGEPGEAGVCVFDTWLGDDVVRAHPLLLVTAPLKPELERLAPSGVAGITPARCEPSIFFKRHNPGCELPDFWAVRVAGQAGVDDFGLAADGSLVISRRVLDVLMRFRLRQAVFAQYARASAPGRGSKRVDGAEE
jgi:hypothetical protein